MATASEDITLLRTKFHRPPVPLDHVHRIDLVTRLEKDPRRPLILVSAPAGYGKSTLVSCWLKDCVRPSAWISLDEHDNDLRTFLSYFSAAICTVHPDAVSQTRALIGASVLPPLSALSAALGNDLEQIDQQFILALDDIHLIHEKAIHDFFEMLLRHPSRAMQMVMIGRRDPSIMIYSLRARGMVTEVRMFDLLFSVDEAGEFLHSALGQRIDESMVATLVKRTEGWVTGLRLSALAMRNFEDISQKILELKGVTRYVAEYLIEEILDNQPDKIRNFLLKTSILNRFCSSLCQSVAANQNDPKNEKNEVWAIIDQLQKEHVFLIKLDAEGEWFRYHHLFQELLKKQLQRERSKSEIEQLHLRASKWFESQGLIPESIEYACKAGDTALAVRIIEQHRDEEFTADRWYNVDRWLAMVPANIRQKSPKLLLTEAWIRNLEHRLSQVPILLNHAESRLRSQKAEPTVSAELFFFRGYLAYFEGQAKRSLQYLTDAIAGLAGTKSPFWAESELMLGLARCMVGQKEAAVIALEAQMKKNKPSTHYLLSRLIAGSVFIHQVSGDLHRAFVEAKRLQRVSIEHNMSLAEAWSYYFLACIHFQRGELDAALLHFGRVAEMRYTLEPRASVDALAGLALTHQLMGLQDETEESYRRLQGFAQELVARNYLSVAQSCLARLFLFQGNFDAAIQQGLSIAEPPVPAEFFCWLDAPCMTKARVGVAAGSEQEISDAVELIESMRNLCESCGFTYQLIDLSVIQALAMEKLGRVREALDSLKKALSLAEPGGWVRPFVEAGTPIFDLLVQLPQPNVRRSYMDKLLVAFPNDTVALTQDASQTQRSTPPRLEIPQPLVEPLTSRELDVLELLAKRLQNKEIAERIVVSPLTVKTHLKNIYQKLQVNNRREAVEKARNLGIMPEK